MCMLGHFSRVQLFGTQWTVACQAPLSMGFSRQEHWSGLPGSPLGDLPDPGSKTTSLCLLPLQAGSLPRVPLRKPEMSVHTSQKIHKWPVNNDRVLNIISHHGNTNQNHCDPMNRSTPGLPLHHQLPEFTPTYIHWVGDAIQPSHPLLSPSPPAPNPSQHQSLFQWVNSSNEVVKVLEFLL